MALISSPRTVSLPGLELTRFCGVRASGLPTYSLDETNRYRVRQRVDVGCQVQVASRS